MEIGDVVKFKSGFRVLEGKVHKLGRVAKNEPITSLAVIAEGREFHVRADAIVGTEEAGSITTSPDAASVPAGAAEGQPGAAPAIPEAAPAIVGTEEAAPTPKAEAAPPVAKPARRTLPSAS